MNNKYAFVLAVCFLVSLALLFASQDENPQWKGTIEEEDGIKVIKNPEEPLYGEIKLELEEDLSIGVKEGKKEYMFSQLSYLAVDDDENIYAMDQREAQVKAYNKNGTFLRTIGKRGEGPGELLHPNEIFITDDNQLVIEDFIRNLTYYSLNGKHIRAQSTAKIFPIGIIVTSKGQILAITNINEPDRSGKEIKLYDEDLSYLKTIISIPKPKPNPQILKPFQPEINWALMKDDNFIISYKQGYELEVFNVRGELIRKIQKVHLPVRITEEDVKYRVRRVQEGRKLIVPKYFPAIHSIITDDEGRILVQTWEKNAYGKYYHDIFDPEGRYIAKVALRDRLQVWRKGKIYSIEEDEEGYQYVKRYKVTWHY